jgi:methyltransferase family protein
MHMLCVRPETTDFVIGSSCDYSFVPEMCPSGNVEPIIDSDEFLVIKMQPRGHEIGFAKVGPLTPKILAKSLSEWTTQVQRDNARHSLIFHAGDLPELGPSLAQANAFVADVAKRLKSRPRPYRGHPYWYGAIVAFYDATGRRFADQEWRDALELPPSSMPLFARLRRGAQRLVLGQPPHVMPWHPAWPDFRSVLFELDSFYRDGKQRLLLLSNEATHLSLALADNGERVLRSRCVSFTQHLERYQSLRNNFDLCLVELREKELAYSSMLLDRIVPLMKSKGRIVVFVRNPRLNEGRRFTGVVASYAESLVRPGIEPRELRFVPASQLRWFAYRGLVRMEAFVRRSPWVALLLAAIGAGVLLVMSFIGNLLALRRLRLQTASTDASSCILRFAVAKTVTSQDNSIAPAALLERAVKSESDRYLSVKRAADLGPLRLHVGRVWHENPTRLLALLAGYSFVAKTLSGVRDVAEIGWSDAFFTRIVAEEVPDVTVYDPDPTFIEVACARQDKHWPLNAYVHDITKAPLPRKHDALFSLNLVAHVPAADEQVYVDNLCASLAEDGVLIIGTPAGGSSASGSATILGRINCRSANEMKDLLGLYFARVFLFSIRGDGSHAGFMPGADYLFAVCTNAKRRAPSTEDFRSKAGAALGVP